MSKLYWYEYLYRGFSLGCQPKDFVANDADYGRFGAIAYDRELTKEEQDRYELEPIKDKK